MSEEHTKTVVIDFPMDKRVQDEPEAKAKPDSQDDYDGYATDTELPTSWLS